MRLSTTYNAIAGDTFDSIARKQYGTELEANRIARANPGITEPINAGAVLLIPDLPGAPQDIPQTSPADNLDEVAVTIAGTRFRFWTDIRIVRAIDAMDIFELSAPFEPDNTELRAAFVPFAFDDVEITVGGAPLFTGTMVAISPTVGKDARTISAGGYSLPGVLNDCTPPASAYPLQFDGVGLIDIATEIAAPFGLSVEFQAEQGAIFERVKAPTKGKALAFLATLAKQRNLIISSTERGALLIWQSADATEPVAILAQGSAPVLSVTPFFNPQEYYSDITGVEPVFVGLAGSQVTVKNPRLEGVLRPFTFEADDTQSADVTAAVEAKAGRMFGNAVSYSVQVATWRDSAGALWAPNTTVSLLAPGAMVYSEYQFIIRSVEFNRNRASETATLDLVIPGAFSGKIPETLPWDE